MRVQAVIQNENEEPAILISTSDDAGWIDLQFMTTDGEWSAVSSVKIEHLRSSIRKLTAR